MRFCLLVVNGILILGVLPRTVCAQGPPPPRMHRIIEKGELKLVPANSTPKLENSVTIEIVGDKRVISANGIPNHNTGQFPNRANPNRISAQSHVFRIPAQPQIADRTTPMRGMFGVAINGVPFDPGAGEFFDGIRGWQYEPLSGAIDLGLDFSYAHVQPNGKYHYHGLPSALLKTVKLDPQKHSPLMGWAADGFPIYAAYGYRDPKDASSEIRKLKSSYQLKKGDRPGGRAPGGKHDGTFVADYEYVKGSGDLDECNGRFTVTPDFPQGTYAYYLTEGWPVVPRVYRGTPSADFRHGPAQRRAGGRLSGRAPNGGPPRPGQVLPDFVQDALNLTETQKRKLAELQNSVDAQLAEILTAKQQDQLKDRRHFGPPDQPRPGPRPGRRR